MPYLLDSNAIITPFHAAVSASLTLGLKVRAPAAIESTALADRWVEDWLSRGFQSGNLVASEGLITEVRGKKDRASKLLQTLRKKGLIQILIPTQETLSLISDIHEFVSTNYEPHQASQFLLEEDPMFIALAKIHQATLITAENHNIPQYDHDKKKIMGKVRISFLAWVFGVRCISLYQAFDELP